MKITKIIKNAKKNSVNVTLNGITVGELMALRNGMKSYAEFSSVAYDVLSYLQNAGIDEICDNALAESASPK
jgi:arabinogalactan endo-1,4-beta-galactosidase